MTPYFAHYKGPLSGDTKVPGDKSISHRAIMFTSLAIGESRITGLLEGEDVMRTRDAMQQMGAKIDQMPDGSWRVFGTGTGGLHEPANVLDMGNSGTTARLLMGLLSSHTITATFVGDESLSKRPMQRIITPIKQLGATVTARAGGKLPLTLSGSNEPLALDYRSPVASAQVKSAVLLSGLNTPGQTTLHETVATRDHSERMLSAMGADLTVTDHTDGSRTVCLNGERDLNPIDITVPGDISSAAFLIVAASILPGSDIIIREVGINPLRMGIIPTLRAMGADITFENERQLTGEDVADIRVRASNLKAIQQLPVHPSRMVDEFPVLFVAAATAEGVSRFEGLSELRVKESDRLAAMAQALTVNGVAVIEFDDGIEITGTNGKIPGGGMVEALHDHRIAMSSLVMGMAANAPVTVDDITPIQTSFPGFTQLMNTLGADITPC